MIASTGPGASIRCVEQCVDLRSTEKVYQGACEAFARDGEQTLDLCRMGWQLERGVAKEGMYCREAQITAAHAEATTLLQIVQKGHDQRCVDLLDAQPRGCLMQALLRERQELSERVAIGTDGVRACLTLLHQALREEALQQRRQAYGSAHGRSSQRCSSRRIASRISSGAPSRYHCVSATWT